jgi:hypothetical protein
MAQSALYLKAHPQARCKLYWYGRILYLEGGDVGALAHTRERERRMPDQINGALVHSTLKNLKQICIPTKRQAHETASGCTLRAVIKRAFVEEV